MLQNCKSYLHKVTRCISAKTFLFPNPLVTNVLMTKVAFTHHGLYNSIFYKYIGSIIWLTWKETWWCLTAALSQRRIGVEYLEKNWEGWWWDEMMRNCSRFKINPAFWTPVWHNSYETTWWLNEDIKYVVIGEEGAHINPNEIHTISRGTSAIFSRWNVCLTKSSP